MKKISVALAVFFSFCTAAYAQQPAWPTKPVRILVGFGAGGGIDIAARTFAQRLTEAMGQSFIVDNRPGAGGTIASDLTSKAAPDGYTLHMISVTHSINATLYQKLPYDTVKSFTPISPVVLQADVIAVHPSVPTKNLRELINLAKARPNEISYAHAGNGTLMHVGMELFLNMAGVKMLAVPYNGSGPSTTATLGGQVPVLSTSLPPSLPHAKSGKLRILAVTTAKRTPLAPEYPTVEEAAGLKGYEAVEWIGLIGPAGLPPAIVNRLHSEIDRIQQTAELKDTLAKQGSDPFRLSPQVFAELIRNDIGKWGKIVRDTGLKQE